MDPESSQESHAVFHAQFYRDFLQSFLGSHPWMGPYINDDGNVEFEYEDGIDLDPGSYEILIDQKDKGLFQMVRYFFYPITSQEEIYPATQLCMEITKRNRVIKICDRGEPSNLQASVEAFIDSPEDATKQFKRYLNALISAVNEFRKRMIEWKSQQED